MLVIDIFFSSFFSFFFFFFLSSLFASCSPAIETDDDGNLRFMSGGDLVFEADSVAFVSASSGEALSLSGVQGEKVKSLLN